MAIRKLRRGAHAKKTINPIVQNLNRGQVVNSQHVIAKILPDKRIQLFLHPDIVRKLDLL